MQFEQWSNSITKVSHNRSTNLVDNWDEATPEWQRRWTKTSEMRLNVNNIQSWWSQKSWYKHGQTPSHSMKRCTEEDHQTSSTGPNHDQPQWQLTTNFHHSFWQSNKLLHGGDCCINVVKSDWQNESPQGGSPPRHTLRCWRKCLPIS